MSRILILGASGMLGNAMLRLFAADSTHEVWGTVRSAASHKYFAPAIAERLLSGVDVDDVDTLLRAFAEVRPEVVINCIGVVKQLAGADDPLLVLPINTLLPHRLARMCAMVGARLIHVSTDCVFNGRKGGYRETDPIDAEDLYGRSKALGEVDYPHAVTLRTSIIGHEFGRPHGLVEWFLAQEGSARGFRRVVFSGLPTVALAGIILDHVLPNPQLNGVYHVAAEAINKFDLLAIAAAAYGKTIRLDPDDTVVIDRSLNADRFRAATGYVAPSWPELVARMRDFK